ncbi:MULTISPECIES: Imm26 family immunity protein [unclassified Exiguobacterium]|uniref:Imm26 family immunity protein n=1 Tax=unclassified Exiguobacterium TaxID=2644629 RepID=UPI001BE77E35|nr:MULTISPECIES: Imm26 family immunity protein [unclassified Exiguobacterium]
MERKFSIEEWRYFLENGLNSLLSTREDTQQMISKLSIQTKKRATRWKLSSGVVYVIPLPRLGGYGYAEIRVSKDKNFESGEINSMKYVQYYNLRTETILSLYELDQKKPETCIIMDTGQQGIREGEWKTIGKRHREETFETPLLFGSVPSLDSDEEYYYITRGIFGERMFVEEEKARAVINPSGAWGDRAAVYEFEDRLKELNDFRNTLYDDEEQTIGE